ncbi:hypothetical protein LIER_25238 [Lithospermum erythrorhizon]|uniref:RNase H type-1 domain-containing protein n=1 Tax=Lithospermum erythrorhizon TaxID=34254 RepID=A0AAV3R658_LITER
MSFLVWRLLQGWLPADEIMMKRGIAIASKCYCCAQVETLEHIFLTNPIAKQVWAYFAGLVGIRNSGVSSVQQVITTWSLSVSTAGHIKQVLPIIIFWELWEARNKAKHDSANYSLDNICRRVHNILQVNSKANMTQPKFWTGDSFLTALLGVHVLVTSKKVPTLYKWEKLAAGTHKLNIDAAGYGGILRNDQGHLVMALGLQGSCTSPIQAEVEALFSCLRICAGQGHKHMDIEVDSLQLVNMIKTKKAPWQLRNTIHTPE